MQEFVTALQDNVLVTLEETERIAQVNTKSKDLQKTTDILNHFLSYFIHQILIALLMVSVLIKENVMTQSAFVYVIKVMKESIVKVTFERLKFQHYEKICLNMTYFQINYALVEALHVMVKAYVIIQPDCVNALMETRDWTVPVILSIYLKIASSNTPRLKAHVGFSDKNCSILSIFEYCLFCDWFQPCNG